MKLKKYVAVSDRFVFLNQCLDPKCFKVIISGDFLNSTLIDSDADVALLTTITLKQIL